MEQDSTIDWHPSRYSNWDIWYHTIWDLYQKQILLLNFLHTMSINYAWPDEDCNRAAAVGFSASLVVISG